MTTTIHKSIHTTVTPVDDTITQDDVRPDAQSVSPSGTSQALVPQGPQFSVLSPEAFQEQLRKIEMWTSYTGPVPKALEDYYNLEIMVKGLIRQDLSHTNEETGVITNWQEIRMKLVDDSIIAATGIGACQFADVVLPSLGQGDWPVNVRVLVKARTLRTSGHKMPTFQVLGPVE